MSFSRLSPGALFGGDYKIVRPLKEGGMGAVYIAEQLSTGALRALKLLHPQYVEDEAMRKRFEQEARAGARIESDYVVNVIGAGVDAATSMPWIAMELLEGEDLGDHVARVKTLSPGEALLVFRMLCHAVGAAHDAGIVHRDLKPENIFLAKSRRPGEPYTLKVLDFGIARAAADVRATGTAALGTPLWMAPEQTSRGPRITPATDVWALGLIAFYLLTGSWYWRSVHLESPSITEFLRELTLGELDPASLRAADLGLGTLPEGFDVWFARCVVRDPGARFQDARQTLAALEPILAGRGHHDVDLATAATAQLTAGMLAAPPKLARPFFVGTETEKALARGQPVPGPAMAPAPPAAPALAPPVTAPATSVTGPAPSQAAPRSRAWLVATPLVVLFAGGGVWLWKGRPTQTVPSTTALASVTASVPPPSLSTPPAAPAPSAASSGDTASVAAQQVAQESPMVAFPAAVFRLGYELGAIDERPVHDVSFPTFLLQKDEVTVAQYARCVAAGQCTAAGTDEFCNGARPGSDRHPINCVTQLQAATYCAWLGRRLPTEDEWEYAASGTAKRLYAWGDTSPVGRACIGRPKEGTCEVGSASGDTTPEGLRDMTGNVREWTASDYCPYDLSLACAHDQKVAKGGAWFSASAGVARTQVRQGYAPATSSTLVGVRCAKAF